MEGKKESIKVSVGEAKLISYALENLRVLSDSSGDWERYHQGGLWETFDYDDVNYDEIIDNLKNRLNTN